MKSNDHELSGGSPTVRWRAHCRGAADVFARFEGSATQVRRAERFEAQAISRLTCDFETLEVRATSLVLLAMVRNCAIRQVAHFFQIETEVVLLALTLQPEAARSVAMPAARSVTLVKAA